MPESKKTLKEKKIEEKRGGEGKGGEREEEEEKAILKLFWLTNFWQF